MPKTKDEKDLCKNRFSVALNDSDYQQAKNLAKALNKSLGTVVRDVLVAYLVAHKDEIDETARAADAYRASLENLRSRQSSLFDPAQ